MLLRRLKRRVEKERKPSCDESFLFFTDSGARWMTEENIWPDHRNFGVKRILQNFLILLCKRLSSEKSFNVMRKDLRFCQRLITNLSTFLVKSHVWRHLIGKSERQTSSCYCNILIKRPVECFFHLNSEENLFSYFYSENTP